MDTIEFEAALRQEGYKVIKGEFRPDPQVQLHTHDFDVRFLVVEGAITIILENDRHLYSPGDVCFVPAGTLHKEHVGVGAAHWIIGIRGAGVDSAVSALSSLKAD